MHELINDPLLCVKSTTECLHEINHVVAPSGEYLLLEWRHKGNCDLPFAGLPLSDKPIRWADYITPTFALGQRMTNHLIQLLLVSIRNMVIHFLNLRSLPFPSFFNPHYPWHIVVFPSGMFLAVTWRFIGLSHGSAFICEEEQILPEVSDGERGWRQNCVRNKRWRRFLFSDYQSTFP